MTGEPGRTTLIEREYRGPELLSANSCARRGAKINYVLRHQLGTDNQWVNLLLANDKMFLRLYLDPRRRGAHPRHSHASGFPATTVTGDQAKPSIRLRRCGALLVSRFYPQRIIFRSPQLVY